MSLPDKNISVELLAPARNLETAVTAVDFGADAVYMGAPDFGARVAAANTIDDIAAAAEYVHRYRARLYVTLNTLLYDRELADAKAVGEAAIAAGADALIVQDMAWLEMGLKGAEFHASTQTYNASPEKVRFLEEAGFSRVVLERGLILERIKAIRAATEVELECFVYGAVCVGGSGRCYLSRSMGPRSGNRGNCAQPCRLEYDLLDGRERVLQRRKHLLSVRDLDLSGRLGDLLDAGVSSFKIEGRLKDTAYVRNSVALLRSALDREIAFRPRLRRASDGVSAPRGMEPPNAGLSGRSVYDFEPAASKSFTRGGTAYMLDGGRKGLADFDSPKSKGDFVGCVSRSERGRFRLDGEVRLVAGDGICFMHEGKLTGTGINSVDDGWIVPAAMNGIKPGTGIYRNYDKRYDDAVTSSRVRRFVPVRLVVRLSVGRVEISARDMYGFTASVRSEGPFEAAVDSGRMIDAVRRSAGRSGREPFEITDVRIRVLGDVPFVPQSIIGRMRRECLDEMDSVRLLNRPQPRPVAGNPACRCPDALLGPRWNVTNALSEKFYRDRGAFSVEHGYDSGPIPEGARVMETPYCILRELGRCRKDNSEYDAPLYLSHGKYRYRLEFDCKNCMMSLIYEPSKPVGQ